MAKAAVKSLEEAKSEHGGIEEGMGRLRTVAYPGFPGIDDFGFYQESYSWLADHELGDQLYRWVAVTGGGEVVGHVSALPQYYRINGERVVAHTPGDFMVHPKHGMQAILLMRNLYRTCENIVACDMVPAAIEVETRLGAQVAGPLHYAVKLLNVSKIPAPRLPGPVSRLLKREDPADSPIPYGYPGYPSDAGTEQDYVEPGGQAPLPVRPRAPIPGPLKKILNSGLSAADGALSGLFARGHEVEVLKEFDGSFDDLYEAVAASVPCSAERNAAFLSWRYGFNSPQHPVTVLGVKEGEALLGYAVLTTDAAGPDGFILDLTARPGRHDVARSLVREAVRFLRGEGAPIVRYRFVPSAVSPREADLRKLGFFFRKDRRYSLLAKFADPGQSAAARHLANWSYTNGDGESTFWLR